MLPVLISFPTTWAMIIAVVGGVLYSTWQIWQHRTEKRQATDFYGVAVGIALAVAAKVYAKPVPLHTYGLLVAGAFLVCTWMVTREVRRLGPIYSRIRKGKWITEDDTLDLSFWILVSALVGSRILFIIVNWDDYAKNPRNILSLSGGLVFYGGLIGALTASIWFAKKRKIRFFELADATIPTVAFGHVMGRLGCFAAGCCFGKQSPVGFLFGAQFSRDSLAYATELREGLITADAAHSLALHPTQLYEATGELLVFVLLLLVRSRLKRFHGQILLTYFIVYALLRTTVETFRGDYERGMLLRWPADNPLLLSTSQTISVALAATGVGLLVWLLRARRRPAMA